MWAKMISTVVLALSLQGPQALAPLRRDLTIGDERSEYAFSSIVDVAVTRQGEIVVVDRSREPVRLFSESGQFLRVIGGIGSGPGEYRAAGRVGFKADTLWLVDYQLGQITYYSPTTWMYARSESFMDRIAPVRRTPPSASTGSPQPVQVLADGSLIVAMSLAQTTIADPRSGALSLPVIRVSSSGIDTLTVMRFLPAWTARSSGDRIVGMMQPFSAHDLVAFARDGTRWITVKRDPAEASQIVLRAEGLSGPSYESRLPGRRAGPTREEIERSIGFMMLAGARDEREARRNLTIPERMPLVEDRDVVAGHGGFTWVAVWSTAESKRWCRIAPTGNLQGCYAGPRDFRPYDAGADFVVGVVLTDLDVPLVVRYRTN